MALVSLGLPVFNGTEEDDLELFISLFLGYIASVNVNYQDHGGNPAGAKGLLGFSEVACKGRPQFGLIENLQEKIGDLLT